MPAKSFFLDVSGTRASQQDRAVDAFVKTDLKLQSFLRLPVGWHYGSGVPLSESDYVVTNSLLKLAFERGFRKFNAFPLVDGRAMLVVYLDKMDVEFRIGRGRPIEIVLEDEAGDSEGQTAASYVDAIDTLTRIKQQCLSESFTTGITITKSKDFAVQRSRYQMKMEAFPPFAELVLTTIRAGSASISPGTIRPLRETRSYIGRLNSQASRKERVSWKRGAKPIPAT